MWLERFDKKKFDRGASVYKEAFWLLVLSSLISTGIPGSSWRVILIRAFGARIGRNVVLKPGIRIKFPWKLTLGNNCWIGEDVWIDNLAEVLIGNDVCISQGCYLCTGSHDWSTSDFELIVQPIKIGDQAWMAAKSILSPGVNVGSGTVLTLGSVAVGSLEPWSIYSGMPAAKVKSRTITKTSL